MDQNPPSQPPLETPLSQAAPPAQAWISMHHVQHMVRSGRAAGINIDRLLALAGLDDERLADGDATVPLRTIELLLATLQQDHADALSGLHLANHIQPATLGALGFILQACTTFADLLDVVQRYNGMLSNIGHSSVLRQPGLVQLQWECRSGSAALRRHASDYVIGTFVVVARMLAPAHEWAPVAVHFAHARPANPDRVREYFAFFRCPVFFEQPVSGISFPASLLPLRLPHGDAVLKDILERHGQNLLLQRTRTPSLVEDVRRLLSALMLQGVPSKESVAQQLGTSSRSLHRHLQEQGTGYRDILDEVRLEQARALLLDSDVTSADIADRLGFRSRQAFIRWFSQHTRLTPGEFRRSQNVGDCPDVDT